MILIYKVIFFDLGETLVSNRMWVPNARELLNRLELDGLRLGIISNTAQLDRKSLNEFLPADFNWSQFEESLILLSSEVHIEKPNVGIFKLAIDKAGIASHLCLFCSENPLDCLVSQQVGMHSYRLQKPPDS